MTTDIVQYEAPFTGLAHASPFSNRFLPARTPEAGKPITFMALLCVMLGSVTGCTKSEVKTNPSDVKTTSTEVAMTSIKDTTLYEDSAGALSNGAGQHMFAGTKGAGHAVRGLVAFDVAGKAPAGMTLTAVKLRLNMSIANSYSAQTIGLHRVLADWGEGATVASGGGGGGGPASKGGATWLHTSFPDTLWSRPGGDFEAKSSASINAEGIRAYEWGSTDQLVADVQTWLDNPSSNRGWLLMASDNSTMVKRFDTRENATEANRPRLTLTFDRIPSSKK